MLLMRKNEYLWSKGLTDDKISVLFKLIAFVKDKLSASLYIKFLFHWVEKTLWEKKENAVDHQHFLLFPQCFQKDFP